MDGTEATSFFLLRLSDGFADENVLLEGLLSQTVRFRSSTYQIRYCLPSTGSHYKFPLWCGCLERCVLDTVVRTGRVWYRLREKELEGTWRKGSVMMSKASKRRSRQMGICYPITLFALGPFRLLPGMTLHDDITILFAYHGETKACPSRSHFSCTTIVSPSYS